MNLPTKNNIARQAKGKTAHLKDEPFNLKYKTGYQSLLLNRKLTCRSFPKLSETHMSNDCGTADCEV